MNKPDIQFRLFDLRLTIADADLAAVRRQNRLRGKTNAAAAKEARTGLARLCPGGMNAMGWAALSDDARAVHAALIAVLAAAGARKFDTADLVGG